MPRPGVDQGLQDAIPPCPPHIPDGNMIVQSPHSAHCWESRHRGRKQYQCWGRSAWEPFL